MRDWGWRNYVRVAALETSVRGCPAELDSGKSHTGVTARDGRDVVRPEWGHMVSQFHFCRCDKNTPTENNYGRKGFVWCGSSFFMSIPEEGTSVEEIPPRDWTVGKPGFSD